MTDCQCWAIDYPARYPFDKCFSCANSPPDPRDAKLDRLVDSIGTLVDALRDSVEQRRPPQDYNPRPGPQSSTPATPMRQRGKGY